MATQNDNNNDIELEKQRLVQRVQQVMENRRKETEGQVFGPRASRPFSAEWIQQQINMVQPAQQRGKTETKKESYLPKEVNIANILADMWSKDRRTHVRRSMQNILVDYEPRPEKPFRSSFSSDPHQQVAQERSDSILAEKTFMPPPQLISSNDEKRLIHQDDGSHRGGAGPQHPPIPPSTFVLNSNSNSNDTRRSPANLKHGGIAKDPVVPKRKRKNKNKTRRSSLREKGPLQSIPEAHMDHSEVEEDDVVLPLVQEVDEHVDADVSCPPLSGAQRASWLADRRAKRRKEKAARKSSPRSYKSTPGNDEGTTRTTSTVSITPPPSPPPSPCNTTPLRDNRQRWEAVSPEMVNVIMLSRNLSDYSMKKVLPLSSVQVEEEEDSNIVAPSASLESSDCDDSNATLPKNELLLQQELSESPSSSPKSSETSDSSNEQPELVTWWIVPDPADPRPPILDNFQHLKDQQPVVSRRKLSVDSCSSNSLEGKPPLKEEPPPIYVPKPKGMGEDNQSLSPMPPLSPISIPGSETSSYATIEISSDESPPPKPEKKKKKSKKEKKQPRIIIISPTKSPRASMSTIRIPELTDTKKEKKPTSSFDSSDTAVSKVADKKEKKQHGRATITGAVPEASSLEKKGDKKEKKPRRASMSEESTSDVSEKKEKRPHRASIPAMTVPVPASEKVNEKKLRTAAAPEPEKVTEKKEQKLRLLRATLRTVAAPEQPTSVKSKKKPRIASIQTTTVADTTSDKSSEEKENKPRPKNTQVESFDKKGKSPKPRKEKIRSSKASDASEKKEKSAEGKEIKKKTRSKSSDPKRECKEIKKKARSKSSDPKGESSKKRRSKSKTPKEPKKSKKTKKKSSKSKSSDEQLSMSMPDLLEASTNSETDFEQSINLNASESSKKKSSYDQICMAMSMPDLLEESTNSETDFEQSINLNAFKSSKSKSSYEQLSMSMPDLLEASNNSESDFEQSPNLNASTGTLPYATMQASSNTNDLVCFISSMMLSKQDGEQEQVEQEGSADELFYSTTSMLSPRSEPVATVKSQPLVSPSERSMELQSETSVYQLESTPITRDEKANASALTEQPNCESQSELFISAHMSFDMDAVEHEEAVEQKPESSERDRDVERTSSIELCSSNLEERELSRQDGAAGSSNELFYSAQSHLSASCKEEDIKSPQSFPEECPQDSAISTSVGEPATRLEDTEARDVSTGIDMKGVQFLLGHLQVILCLDALIKYPNEDKISPYVLPPIEAKIRARWGLVNALEKTEEAKQAQEDFALQYGLLSTDVDELISHLRLCEKTGADVRWDLVYEMVFPESEIRWGVFDQIFQAVNSPTTHPYIESVEWSDGSSQKQGDGPTPTTDVPVKGNSLDALFTAAAAKSSNPNEVRGMAHIEDEMEASDSSSNTWSYANALLYDSQAQLAFRMEYDVTDGEFAAMLRYLSHCKATNATVEWDRMEQVLCDVPEGVYADSEVEDGSDSGSDHSSYCSANDWNAESVAGESYFSVYPEHDDCASELTFYYDDRSVYMEDDMSIGSHSAYTWISEALTEGPKEPAADNTNQNPLQLPDSTMDALRITRSSSFNGPRRGPGRSSSFNGIRRGLGRSCSFNKPMRGPVRTSSFNGPRRGPGRTSSFNGPRRGLGPNSSFSGPRRGKRGMLFNRIPLASILDTHDSGLTLPSAQSSDRATAGSSSVVMRKPPRLLRRYHSASAALENLAEALVHQRASF